MKQVIGVLTVAALIGLAMPATAQQPSDTAKPGAAATMQGNKKMGAMDGKMKGQRAGMHGHKRSCYDAAWQSEAWQRCEAMMGKKG